ncbi:carbohydrate ABC transporter membrane protein 2 (CUT1 family) [Roseiarcus fermentans]|uniref:Carbohydrate ABC transporter membrane protein 2 (CUT1 family) n=1 Tax=Roseiarcus fermentans TaxID=1473586 RepID=A0A366FNH4_9HYPH|nr:carbohydrate ABC transporter permease [Roseiarcus fermentans]RBP16121.1 carbohydrate ABC transporter membrane protein 2 (CUT1 family) [Roseiarcus fermentans]
MTEASPIAPPLGATLDTPAGDRRPLAGIVLFAALIVIAGAVLAPIAATALNGFKALGDLQTHPFNLPQSWIWANYWDILASVRYWQVLGNSLLIALLTVALTLALSSMAAFAFAHLKFFGDRFLLSYLQLGLLFPLATAILPLFITVRDLGLLDSYLGVVLPQVAFSLAMGVLLLRNAFRQLPAELLDAAMMDGCGYFRYFFFITLPLSGPILSTVAVISFVASWNGYLLPLVVFNSESRYPWTLGLMAYQGQYSTSWQLVLAFITLTILPAILMFLVAQRYIVAGLTAGAVKG